MTRALWLMAVAFGVVFACTGGELDAFVEQSGGISPGGTSAGGSAGTTAGGRGGSSGMSVGGEGEGGSADLLPIDDFEDGNRTALLGMGQWYVSNDGSGVQTLAIAAPSVERPGSAFALHTSGLGFERLVSVICDVAGDNASFDASDYAALTFSARAEAGPPYRVLFAFLVGSQHFTVPLMLGTEWEVHTISFADVLPSEDGPLPAFDPRAIAAIQFAAPVEVSFDFWLDDLAFVK